MSVKFLLKNIYLFIIILLCSSEFIGCAQPYRKIHGNRVPSDVVFHGSNHNKIKILAPRNIHIRDPDEGSVIFATPSIKLASCYLFRWDSSWVHQSVIQEKNNIEPQVIMIISDKERLIKHDTGGSVYILPASSFTFSANKGLGLYEGVSKEEVSPFTQINFSSALSAMLHFGVKVYFVDKKQFIEISKINDNSWLSYLEKNNIYVFDQG